MPALVAGIHVFFEPQPKSVDGRVKPGHDEERDCHKLIPPLRETLMDASMAQRGVQHDI
jgi:hypothetical protein